MLSRRTGRDDRHALRCAGRTMALAVAVSLLMPAGLRAELLPIKTYSFTEGLSHNRVKRIVQDSHGFVWICTFEGLSRFDGSRFTNYGTDQGLPFPSLNDMMEMPDGTYWIATNGGGMIRFRPIADVRPATDETVKSRFTSYAVSQEGATNRVNVIFRTRTGAMWLGTDGGLFQLEETGVGPVFRSLALGLPEHPDLTVQVWSMTEDHDGSLWIATKFGVLRRLPDGRLVHYAVRPGLSSDNVYFAQFDDSDGTVWLAHEAGGLLALKIDSRQPVGCEAPGGEPGRTCESTVLRETNPAATSAVRRYTTVDGLPFGRVLGMHRSPTGRIWIASRGAGLAALERGRLVRYASDPRVPHSAVSAITEDRDGNLWLSTVEGAMKIARHGLVTYDESDGLGLGITAIFENRAGDLLVSSGGYRIGRFDGHGFQSVRFNLPAAVDDESWRMYRGVLEDRTGDYWVATPAGLVRFPPVADIAELSRVRPKAVYTTRDGLANNNVGKLFEDSRGDIWIGTFAAGRDTLTRWDRASATFHAYGEADGLPPFSASYTFGEDTAGNVWIGLMDGGVARYARGRFTRFAAEDGIPNGSVQNLFSDHRGRLWIALMLGGVVRIDHPEAERLQSVFYGTREGLSSGSATVVTEDQRGFVYIGTTHGLDRLDPQTGRVQHFTTADGLAGVEMRVAYRDGAGSLWLGMTSGLSRFVPEPDRPQRPPTVLLDALRIAGVDYHVSELGAAAITTPELGPNQNQLTVNFGGLSFEAGEALRYQYRLDGADRDWSPPTDQRTVNYANLSPGRYRFSVRALSLTGQMSPSPATVDFRILPPFWRRWWFLTTIALATFAALAAFDRYRVARMKELKVALDESRELSRQLVRSREERFRELEQVRARIATDLHDDVGSSLTRISLLTEVVRRQVAEDTPVTSTLSLIAQLARELVDSMGDLVWAINPVKDHLSDLTQRMRHFASDVFTARQIELHFSAPDREHDIRVGANVRRELFLVYKEAINNIVRHAMCTMVEVELRADADRLSLRLRDNGQGFDVAHASGGNGLASLRERTNVLRGTLDIASQPGRGTTVTLMVPTGSRAQNRDAAGSPHVHAVTSRHSQHTVSDRDEQNAKHSEPTFESVGVAAAEHQSRDR